MFKVISTDKLTQAKSWEISFSNQGTKTLLPSVGLGYRLLGPDDISVVKHFNDTFIINPEYVYIVLETTKKNTVGLAVLGKANQGVRSLEFFNATDTQYTSDDNHSWSEKELLVACIYDTLKLHESVSLDLYPNLKRFIGE